MHGTSRMRKKCYVVRSPEDDRQCADAAKYDDRKSEGGRTTLTGADSVHDKSIYHCIRAVSDVSRVNEERLRMLESDLENPVRLWWRM